MKEPEITAQEIIAKIYANGYAGRLASSPKGDAIAYHDGERWVMFISATITGEWYEMPFEILINGQHPFTQEQWTEHARVDAQAA